MTIPCPIFRSPRHRFLFYIAISVLTTTCVFPYKGDFGGGEVLKSSASERYMVSRERSSKDGGNGNKIICTEPSPDVASTLSALFKSSVSVPQSVDVKTTLSASQALVQLGKRYAAIQMLRDMHYADCQAYANGILTASQYAALRSRAPQLAVTMLAMEMLGGESTEQYWSNSTKSLHKRAGTADAGDAGKPDDGGTYHDSEPDNSEDDDEGVSGFSKSNRSIGKDQADNIYKVYDKFSDRAFATPFAIACIGILENAKTISEMPNECTNEQRGEQFGCVVSDDVYFCQLYMKWLTTMGVDDAGTPDGGPVAGPGTGSFPYSLPPRGPTPSIHSIPTPKPPSMPTPKPPSMPTPKPPSIPFSSPPAVPDSTPPAVPDSIPPAVPDSIPPAVPKSIPPSK